MKDSETFKIIRSWGSPSGMEARSHRRELSLQDWIRYYRSRLL
jgi:hypothetical protein